MKIELPCFLFFIPGTLLTLNLPIKTHLSSAVFTGVILVSNYRVCKGERKKLMPYYMTDKL